MPKWLPLEGNEGRGLSCCGFRYGRIWLGIGLGLVGVVWYLSLTSVPPDVGMVGNDKSAHMLAYAVQMLWFSWLYPRTPNIVGWGLYFVLQGALLELLQGLNPARVAEMGDMLANTVGVLSGWGLARVLGNDLLRRIDAHLALPSGVGTSGRE